MPFKIVQIIENEKILLTVVPSKWERDKTLYWPVGRNEVKLIHDGNSSPKPEWKTTKCEVKREFATYAEANEELEIMEQKSDTDFTDSEKAYKNVIKEEDNSSPLQLECFSQGGEIISEVQGENNAESAIITVEVDKAIDIQFVALNKTLSNSTNTESNLDMLTSVTQHDMFLKIMETQKKIVSQLAVLQSSVDFLMRKTINAKAAEQPKLNRLPINPIRNKKDLDELEEKLREVAYYNNVIAKMTFICGDSGKSRGADCCYKLIDYFFTREILLSCNWTGSTRDNAEKKIPLKFYSRIRNCFFDIVRKADINFTENDGEHFFKVIIKNSKQRICPKINSVARSKKARQTLIKSAKYNSAGETEKEDVEKSEAVADTYSFKKV